MDLKLNESHIKFLETTKEQEQSVSHSFWSEKHPGIKLSWNVQGFTLP